MPSGHDRRHQKSGGKPHQTIPATTAELGLAQAQQQDRCTEVVALAEKRIGQEVKRGRDEGTILKAHEQTRRKPERGSAGHHAPPATLAELGLKKHHNRDFKEMAEVPAEVIHRTVEAARVKAPSTSRISHGAVTNSGPASRR
jgi:hypothetical protein